nr:hypothetical protein Iba_chr03cCG7750 [Ipomoea batatas]
MVSHLEPGRSKQWMASVRSGVLEVKAMDGAGQIWSVVGDGVFDVISDLDVADARAMALMLMLMASRLQLWIIIILYVVNLEP